MEWLQGDVKANEIGEITDILGEAKKNDYGIGEAFAHIIIPGTLIYEAGRGIREYAQSGQQASKSKTALHVAEVVGFTVIDAAKSFLWYASFHPESMEAFESYIQLFLK